MGARGSYRKGIAKREEILTIALDVVAREGYGGTSLRELADAVGLSQTGLLHYFESKDELLTAVLKRRDELDGERLRDVDGPYQLAHSLRHNATVPGLVMLYARLSVEAADADHPAHEYFAERFEDVRAHIAEIVRVGQAEGTINPALDPDMAATIALALGDGLQIQWLYDRDVDMAAHVEHLWESLVRVVASDDE
ncbi:TetR/AcrR family transcriptional regulator [Pseudactinotalea terrae]|uniref:TetR/AcrR family transcriptional regulator n=1 Tax=Pseudactinotalea terrae TaxID=1743262 RepID=UPI00188344A5|nr:TetR/AcrR family transcriptional regulator [Pseudactinotalea terrae]